MHSIHHSKSRHNIFSKVDHDKTYLKQHVNNNSTANLTGASSSGAGGSFVAPPIHQSPNQRKASGSTQSLFSPVANITATTTAIIASGGVPTAPTKGSTNSNNTPNSNITTNPNVPSTPGAPADSSPLPNIGLDVRKRLAANDLAVKIAAKAPVLTPASKMGRDSFSSPSSKPNINIFGDEEEEEYANLQIGYVESEYGDDLDDDARSVASNHSDRLETYKRSRLSMANIAKIRELPNEDDDGSDHGLDGDHHHAHGDQDYDELEDDDDFNEHEMSKTDPRQYKSPLDAHRKLMKMSKVKNRLKAIQALSSKKVIPTDEILNEHRKTRLTIKNSAPSLKDTLSDYNTKFDKPTNLSSKSFGTKGSNNSPNLKLSNGEDAFEDDSDDDDISEAAPRLRSSPNSATPNSKLESKNSFLGGLSKSPSFRFLNALTAGPGTNSNNGNNDSGSKLRSSFLSKSFRSLAGISDDNEGDDEKKSTLDGGGSQAGGSTIDKGLSYKAPLDSIHKPIISRKLTSVTFNRFADGKKSFTENPTTLVRMLDKMQNLNPDGGAHDDAVVDESSQPQQKSAYHIPALSKIEDENNGKLMKRIDSWITRLTFVEAEKKPEPPPPTRKPDPTVENVFGLDGLLMKAEIPADEMIDDDEYDRLLGRTPASEQKKNDQNDTGIVSPSMSPMVNDSDGMSAIKQARQRRAQKRISFSNTGDSDIAHTDKKQNETPVKQEPPKDTTPKLAPYAKALSRTAQSFISSFHQHKENREKNVNNESTNKNDSIENALVALQTPLKKKPEPSTNSAFTPLNSGPVSRAESPSLISLPYDDENSNVKMIPRPHPFAANSPSPALVPAPQNSSPKSILKSNNNSPAPIGRKTLPMLQSPSPTNTIEPNPHDPVSSSNFNPPKVVVSAEDNLEFEYQHSTNSYVPKGYINHTELGIYDRHSPTPKSPNGEEEFFSERHLQEIEESTAGFTQPVIYLPPDAYHVPIVQNQSISNASLATGTLGSGSVGTKSNVLIFNPNHSSSMRDLTNPLLLNSKGSRDKTSLLSSSLEASDVTGGDIDPGIFDDGDDEVVDEEFYPHMKQPSQELQASTVSTTHSSLTKAPRNEQIFKPGVVVTKSSFPEVIHNVVFPDNVAAQPHLVHYNAGMYQHVAVNPQQDSALSSHHERLSKQLAARQQAKDTPPGAVKNQSMPPSPASSLPSTSHDQLNTPKTSTPTPAAAGMASTVSPRVTVPPLTSLDAIHQQRAAQGPRRTSSTPSTTDELKKKFMKSNPELLHTASTLDMRDEILHFMKQSGSAMAGQYEQHINTTCKTPKRHRRDSRVGDNDDYDIDDTSTFMSEENSSGYGDNAMTMTAKMALNQGFKSPTTQFQAQQSNGRMMSPTAQQQAYNRLKESLDKRYANDKEGAYHMNQKIKKYLHDGVTEEYKIKRTYIDEIDDWK